MPSPLYTWDPEKRRYVDESGKTVAESRVRSWVDKLTVAAGFAFIARALLVQDSKKQPKDWAIEMRQDITSLHTVTSIVAAGGVQQTTNEFWTFAQQEIALQDAYFTNFSNQVVVQALATDDAFVARNALYAEAGFATYENAVAIREFTAGMNLYKRILSGNEPDGANCADCLDAEQLGWQTRGQLPRIGDSICRTRCRCHFEFKLGTLDDIGTGAVSRTAELFRALKYAA